jgi:arabinofuranosyltransferase
MEPHYRMFEKRWVALLITLIFFSFILIRTAWVGDDAFITARTVQNLLHGYGPTFNIAERVQAFTHPAWFLVLSLGTAVTGNVIVSLFLIPIILSIVTMALVVLLAPSILMGIIGAAALMLSRSFIDFSTSGLENPLAHILTILFIVLGLHLLSSKKSSHIILFFLLGGSLYLVRPDLVLLILPLALFVFFKTYTTPLRAAVTLMLAATPTISWTIFSLWYYGFPFPNTAYAKLGAGIPKEDLVEQGFRYLHHSLMFDPITIVIIAIALLIGLRSKVLSMISLGIVLYLSYIVWIGGDFMEGRFFSVLLVASIFVIYTTHLSKRERYGLISAVIFFGAFNLPATILSGLQYEDYSFRDGGIANERGYYYQIQGLFSIERIDYPWEKEMLSVEVACGGLGRFGLEGGPSRHMIDTCGLSDPLLARLPAAARDTGGWRIGHFDRNIPIGYKESIIKDANLLQDEEVRDYYDSIRLITRGDLLSVERLHEIVRMNLGFVKKPGE